MNNPLISVRGIVLRKHEGTWQTLLLKRAESSSFEAGHWECPGGQLVGNLGVAMTLCRELVEETGLKISLALEGFVLADEYKIRDGKYADRWYLSLFQIATIIRDSPVQLSAEHSEYLWVPIDQVGSFSKPASYPLSKRTAKGFKVLWDKLSDLCNL